jgi:hypothetical protein
MLYFIFRFLITVLSKNITFFFLSPTPFFFYYVLPVPYLFHPSYLLSLPLSPFATFPLHTCSIVSLFIAHSAPSFLSFHPIPVFSLLVHTSKYRHHFSFSPCTPEFPLSYSYTSHILSLVSGFFDSFPSFLLVCVFVPFTQLYIHPSSFCSQSFHFFIGIPVSLVVFLPLSPSSVLFLFSPAFRQYSILPSILSSNFTAFFPAFTLSLFLLHSFLIR